ncbi:D-alanyl-lipoteichoic acid acyltransferase DltB (MBOAT superfamily) [Dyadobacter jejuensis]|uniref:D-alanyl-lipoteichoic acid acyltransferase DltB (MBOAT superfamily) n=1 Tax=Dyadobacter jejuensis TaxID=1082580 RepID=A0A316AHD8_9BACT|nr:MBOAT family O-acyltransferase [Dyadobacter jejuensis]PWJ57186.1 D-alanyl-lipoteichoic acid acyltransferase DltB (MBOAT superfamily) [Dyadobacter jejuensis]
MLFNSIQFLVFFIVVTLAYFSLSWRGRWFLLLAASCYFYMVFKPVFILILFGTIIIDYFAGIWIGQAKEQKHKKLLLILSLISNIGILAFFKYYDFLGDSFNALFHMAGLRSYVPPLTGLVPHELAQWMVDGAGRVILPIGLSFHTFQAMSYTIEVYRGNQKPERHFGVYALYVMFYPQLVAGPIERPQNMLFQFHSYFKYDFERLKSGLMQMAFGFFKKLVIADRLAEVVNHVYDNPADQNGLSLLIATMFFAFQIYCDFSGYSDIAIGAARVMGFTLMDNFRSPYESASISEFWGRWHISLSTWFRDYLYIPLGGNRKGELNKYRNQFIVFLVSGLWHGASWNYVIWGALHGSYQVGASLRDRWMKKMGWSLPKNRLTHLLGVFVTFGLVTIAWVFFRNHMAPVSRSFTILHKIATLSWSDTIHTPYNSVEMFFCVFLVAFLMVKEHYFEKIPTKNTGQFFLLFSVIAFLTYFLGVVTDNQFIYFQF